MTYIVNITLFLIALCAIFILFKKKIGSKITPPLGNNASPDHLKAQEEYNILHNKEEEIQSLTLEERIELSWAFLLNITEQVMSRFSMSDQKKVDEAGLILSKNGVRYQHNVSEEARIVQSIIKSRGKDQEVEQSRSL